MTRHALTGLGPLCVVAAIAATGCRGPVASDLPSGSPREVRAEARACDRGEPTACTNVAAAWRDGSLGVVDDVRAAALLEPACAAGAHIACVALSELVDDARARELLRGACPPEPIACLHLGRRLRDDEPTAAYEAFSTACAARILDACLQRGLMLRAGVGVAADPETATDVIRDACAGGSMAACRELSRIHAETDDDPTIARTLALGACQGSDAEACAMAADFMEAAAAPEDRESAPVFRSRACELGYQPACAAPTDP